MKKIKRKKDHYFCYKICLILIRSNFHSSPYFLIVRIFLFCFVFFWTLGLLLKRTHCSGHVSVKNGGIFTQTFRGSILPWFSLRYNTVIAFREKSRAHFGVNEVGDYDSSNWLGNKLSVTYALWRTSTWGPMWRAKVWIRTRPWWTPLNPDGSHVLLWGKNIKWDKLALVFSLLG